MTWEFLIQLMDWARKKTFFFKFDFMIIVKAFNYYIKTFPKIISYTYYYYYYYYYQNFSDSRCQKYQFLFIANILNLFKFKFALLLFIALNCNLKATLKKAVA